MAGMLWGAFVFFFFFQAEDGIRDLVRSRGLGDVYKRQRQPDLEGHHRSHQGGSRGDPERSFGCGSADHHRSHGGRTAQELSLIHI